MTIIVVQVGWHEHLRPLPTSETRQKRNHSWFIYFKPKLKICHTRKNKLRQERAQLHITVNVGEASAGVQSRNRFLVAHTKIKAPIPYTLMGMLRSEALLGDEFKGRG